MPTFALACDTCQHRWEVFHSMKADHPPCPKCRKPSRVDWTQQPPPRAPATDLHGSRQTLIDTQAQPREVAKLRQMYGEGVGHVWQDDGSVKVNSPAEAKKFYAKDAEIRARFKDQKAAGKLKSQPKAMRDRAGRVIKAAPKAKTPAPR